MTRDSGSVDLGSLNGRVANRQECECVGQQQTVQFRAGLCDLKDWRRRGGGRGSRSSERRRLLFFILLLPSLSLPRVRERNENCNTIGD